jgi:predicted kinase
MAQSLLVIVTGPPCSGKTSLARRVATACRLPLFSKDGFKEVLYDGVGWRDPDLAAKLNAVSFDLLYVSARTLLDVGQSLILEANFRPDVGDPTLRELGQAYDAHLFQIHCYAAPDTLIARFRRRWQSGRRHPGHRDDEIDTRIADNLRQRVYGPMDLPGDLLRVNTTDFCRVNPQRLITAVQYALDHLKEL